VIDYTVDNISNGPVRDDMIKMMLAGITVEELVEQITFTGCMAGAFTPDVAELVKPAIGIFLADMAIQEGFEPQMFVDEGPIEGSVSDEAFFKIMKEKNPELFRTMLEETNRMQRQFDDMERSELDYAMQKEQKEEDLNNSFMRVEEKS
jgi:hypothetical protein